jgi:hypothetical protein
MTTPVLPDYADLDTFGGTFVNHAPVEDPETDMDAAFQNRVNAQLVMLSLSAPRTWLRCNVGGGAVTPVAHASVWGITNDLLPTCVWVGVGHYTVTWASAYNDLQAVPESHPINLRAVHATCFTATAARIINARRTSTTSIEVRTWDATGAAADVGEFTVVMF